MTKMEHEGIWTVNRFVSLLILISLIAPSAWLGSIVIHMGMIDYFYGVIYAPFWMLNISIYGSYPSYPLQIGPHIALMTFPFWIGRFFFPLMLRRVYQKKTTVRRAFTAGVVGECWTVGVMLLNIILIFLFPSPYTSIAFAFPFPIATISGWIYLKRIRPKNDGLWVEEEEIETEPEEAEYWWEKDEQEESDTIVVPRRIKPW